MKYYNAKNSIQFDYSSFGDMSEYVDFNAELLNQLSDAELLQAEDKDKIQALKSNYSKKLLGDRKVYKNTGNFAKGGNLEVLAKIAKAFRFEEDRDSAYLIPPNVGEGFKVVIKNQRSAIQVIEGFSLEGGVRIRVLSDMAPYGNERFSVGFTAPEKDFGFAIIGRESTKGTKGAGELIVSYFSDTEYVSDYLSNYIDVAAIERRIK